MPHLFLYACIVLFLYSGCEYSRHTTRSKEPALLVKSLAILPFNNRSQHIEAGQIMTDLFYTELVVQDKFSLVQPNIVQQLVSEHSSAVAEIIETHSLRDLASTLSADAIVHGTVTEYYYKKGIREKPVVGLDVKLISIQTGNVIWAGSYTREELKVLFYDGSLNSTAQKLCRKIAGQIERFFE